MYDNLPNTLKEHKGWLVWRFKQLENGKKPLKIPYYTEGKWRKGTHGSREDRAALSTYKKALDVLEKSKGRYEGLGFALLADWNLIAVDFDDCVDKRGNLHPGVLALVDGTYWEFSPSGKGVRAFFSGHVRDAKSLNKAAREARGGWGVEFFCSAGFVTITGNVAPEVELIGADIVPFTPAIRELYDNLIGSHDDVNDQNEGQALVGMTDDEIKRMLEAWDADCDYETWLNVGMAIHHETQGEGFDLWHEWSAQGSKYEGEQECQYKWESFGRAGKKSLKTVRWMINEKGLDFSLENSTMADEFKPLPKLIDDKTGLEKPRSIKPSDLSIKGNGMIEPTMTNISTALGAPGFCGWEFKKDTFLFRTLCCPPGGDELRELKDEDFTRLSVFLEKRGFDKPSSEKVRASVFMVAEDNQFHSAQRWLREVVPAWDGVERIKHYAKTFLGCTDDKKYAEAASLYAWTAHAGRVLSPGVKADMMPVLIGPQKVGKSSNIRAIAPEESMAVTLNFSSDNKVLIENTIGKIVAEFPELEGLGKKEANTVKEYITRQEERYRFPYDRMAQDIPRTFIMWGTSNDDRFLTDPTGNRRFLPMHVVGSGDLRFTKKDMLQHWAEARDLFLKHGILMADEANELAAPYRERARVEDPWEETFASGLHENSAGDGVKFIDREHFTTEEVLVHIFGMTIDRHTSGLTRRVSTILKRYGYEQTSNGVRMDDGSRKRVWRNKLSVEELV